MINQSPFMIMAEIEPGRETALREIFAGMNQKPGMADPKNPVVPFYQLRQLHFARFVILEASTNDDIREFGLEPRPWPPTLVFVGDVDGPRDLFLAELVIRAEDGLRRIFSHCRDFDAGSTDLLQWMKQRNVRPSANYINWRGRSVEQVREERALYEALQARLPQATSETGGSDPKALRRHLKEYIDEEVAALNLRLTPEPPTPFGEVVANFLHLVGVPLILLLLSPLILLGAPFYLIRLRQLEESDPDINIRPDRARVEQLALQEDHFETNQFNVFGQVKPGWFRVGTIGFLLWIVDYTARHIYRRGYLTRIQTINFARWVLLDRGRRVFFASNYDGSLDSYMDDFINKVGWGLNLVFSNGIGYPPTRWLIKGGAKFEGRYKKTLRRNQLPSETWYKAYPGINAIEMARNSRVRKGLEKRNPGVREVRDWLSLL